MKIFYLNVYQGIKEKKRRQQLIQVINKEQPDIICLCELNDWNEQQLKHFSKQTKMQHYYFTPSNTTYTLGIFTKEKATTFKPTKKGFHHALINLKLSNINIFFTHLNPFGEEERMKETEQLIKLIKKQQQTLIIGDLNSLSPLDHYDEQQLLQKQRQQGIKKFGEQQLLRNVQTTILQQGFIDAIKEKSYLFEHTTPTKYNKDKAHLTRLRIDYAYITKDLQPILKQAKVLRTKETEQLSDHYPLIIELELNKQSP